MRATVCDKGNIMKNMEKGRPAPTKGFWDWLMGGGWRNP
jgi:hypothetical protein